MQAGLQQCGFSGAGRRCRLGRQPHCLHMRLLLLNRVQEAHQALDRAIGACRFGAHGGQSGSGGGGQRRAQRRRRHAGGGVAAGGGQRWACKAGCGSR